MEYADNIDTLLDRKVEDEVLLETVHGKIQMGGWGLSDERGYYLERLGFLLRDSSRARASFFKIAPKRCVYGDGIRGAEPGQPRGIEVLFCLALLIFPDELTDVFARSAIAAAGAGLHVFLEIFRQ